MKIPTHLLSAPLLLAAPAAAQELSVVLATGDTFPGMTGSIASISQVEVNDNGWLIEARTDEPREVLISDAGLVAQQGDLLPSPAGAVINNWDSIRTNDSGDRSHNILISGTESVVYWNDIFQMAEGDAATAAGFPAGSTYIDFREAWINDSNQLLIQGSVDPGFQSFLLLRELDAAGALVSEELLAFDGDMLPGMATMPLVESLDGIGANGNNQVGFNDSGEVIFGVGIDGVIQPNANNAYYLRNADGTFTVVAREGQTDPLSGRLWKTLQDSVDVNDFGEFAYRGRYDAPGSGDWAIIRNNVEILAEEGGTIPAIAPFVFGEFSNFLPSGGPVRIDNSGNVLWFGEWFDGFGTSMGRALFLNQDILVEEGVSTFMGAPLLLFGDEFDISDDGRFVIFSGTTTGGIGGAFLLDLAQVDSFCNGDGGVTPGCTDCPCGNNATPGTVGGCLNSSGTSAELLPSGVAKVAGDTLRFELTGANPMTFGVLVSGNNALPNAGPCPPGSGILSPTLDGLRCTGGGLLRHGSRPTDASGAIGLTTNGWGPPNGPLGGIVASSGFTAGQTRNFQVFYREQALMGCATGQNTSQAIGVTVLP